LKPQKNPEWNLLQHIEAVNHPPAVIQMFVDLRISWPGSGSLVNIMPEAIIANLGQQNAQQNAANVQDSCERARVSGVSGASHTGKTLQFSTGMCAKTL
jgi:hypothetical protein